MDSDEPPQPISSGYRLDLVVKFLVVHIKMPKLNVNMLALFFLFKDIEKCIEHKNAIIELRKSYQQEVLRNAD